jgi:hypothetical protein
MILAVVVGSLAMTIWGVTRNASCPGERQKTLAALFGGWPPTKGNIFLMVAFFGGLVMGSWWLCIFR